MRREDYRILSKGFAACATRDLHLAKRSQAQMDTCEPDSDECAGHAADMEAHTACAKQMSECVKSFDAAFAAMKADSGDGDPMPLPEGLSKLAPTNPQKIRPVPRFGSPDLPAAENVEPEFRSLVQVESGQE